MEFEIEIAQSEDRLWRFRIEKEMMWIGGFPSYQAAYNAAVIELHKKVSCTHVNQANS